MRAFACPVCRGFVPFEALRCPSCAVSVGLHLPSRSMLAVTEGRAAVDGQAWVRCTQHEPLGCNWLVPSEYDVAARGRCLPESLIRREPDPDDTIARENSSPPRWHCGG